MGLIKPKKLKPGDTIGIMAPSGWGEEKYSVEAKAVLEKAGFKVKLHPQTNARHFVSAGTAQERIQALHDVFLDPEIDAVFALKGGLRAMQMLDGIDFDIIRQNPKIFIGYSDVTFLLSTFYSRAELVTFHGLTLSRYLRKFSTKDQSYTLDFLQGKTDNILWSHAGAMETLCAGEMEGILFGGNFSLVTTLQALGDAYRPDLTGKILLLEDIGEEIRQIDRMFLTMKLNGTLDNLAGLVIGGMDDIVDTGENYKYNRTVRDLVLEHVSGWDKPVVFHAPFGHGAANLPFPIGIRARLTAPANGVPQLQLLESPFADA